MIAGFLAIESIDWRAKPSITGFLSINGKTELQICVSAVDLLASKVLSEQAWRWWYAQLTLGDD